MAMPMKKIRAGQDAFTIWLSDTDIRSAGWGLGVVIKGVSERMSRATGSVRLMGVRAETMARTEAGLL